MPSDRVAFGIRPSNISGCDRFISTITFGARVAKLAELPMEVVGTMPPPSVIAVASTTATSTGASWPLRRNSTVSDTALASPARANGHPVSDQSRRLRGIDDTIPEIIVPKPVFEHRTQSIPAILPHPSAIGRPSAISFECLGGIKHHLVHHRWKVAFLEPLSGAAQIRQYFLDDIVVSRNRLIDKLDFLQIRIAASIWLRRARVLKSIWKSRIYFFSRKRRLDSVVVMSRTPCFRSESFAFKNHSLISELVFAIGQSRPCMNCYFENVRGRGRGWLESTGARPGRKASSAS